MAINNELKTKIVLRNDTAAKWEEINPVLLEGEIGIENDTGLFKIGIKDTNWNDLSYANRFEEVDLSEVTNSYQQVGTYEDLADGRAIGDVGIVKAHIANDDSLNASYYSYTCYIWDGEQWAAADGNYNASNVIFDEDLTYTTSIGALKLASGKSSDTYAAKGKSLEEVIKRIMAETIDPTVTYPTASLSASFTMETGGTGEVGTYLASAKATGNFTDGRYQYGSNSNKTLNSNAKTDATWTIKNEAGEQIAWVAEGTVTFDSKARPQLTETVYTYDFSAIVELHLPQEGTYIPLNNIGEEVENKRITGFDVHGTNPKNLTATASATGYRKPFWGAKSSADSLSDPTAITAAQVRALGSSGTSVDDLPKTWNLGELEAKQLYFAAKAGTKTSLTIKNVTKEPATAVACTKVDGAVLVPGANNYGWDETEGKYTVEAGACAYDLWYVNLDAPFSKNTSLTLEWK